MGVLQRVASQSRLNFYEESTFDSDSGIAAGYVLPLNGPSRLVFGQNLISAPVFKADLRPFSKVLGPVTAAGQVPLNLEFTTLGRLLAVFLGRTGYSRPGGGSTSVHRFLNATIGNAPQFCQFENAAKEGTNVVQRARGCRIQNMNFSLGTSGPAVYSADVLGIGDLLQGATELFAPTDDGIVPTTYFNGYFNYKAATQISELSAFTLNLMHNVARSEVFANSGIGGALPAGNLEPKGSVRLLWTLSGSNPGADLNAWNDAVNATEIFLECVITDFPINGGPSGTTFPTKYFRVIMPTCRFGAASWAPGGMAGHVIQQPFEAARSINPGTASSSIAGEVWNTVQGPWTFTGANNVFTFKIDGGGNLAVTTTTGSRTAAQVVADLTANGPLNAVAIADVWLGNRVRVRSRQGSVGAASSVQFVTGQANGAETLMGYDNISRVGVTDCEFFAEMYNAKITNY